MQEALSYPGSWILDARCWV